jgi:hypothetical protein
VEITFCDRCDASIPQADLERRAARQRGGLVICAHCLARERRSRMAVLVLGPLSLLAAAALGAVGAVLVLTPRLEVLEAQVRGIDVDPSAAHKGLRAEMQGIRQVDLEQSRAISDLRDAVDQNARDVSASLRKMAAHLTPLEAEVRAVKEHILGGGAGGAPLSTAPEPAETPKPAEPDALLETWLPLVEDPDPGVRLSALVALEASRDERVTSAALEALEDPDSLVRAQAVQMLGERKEEKASPGLIGSLSDTSVRVRAVAEKALTAIAGTDYGYDPTDPEEQRKKAIAAFREWAKSRD